MLFLFRQLMPVEIDRILTERLEYTLHGDTVNTAARLESLDKDDFEPDRFSAPCRILVGAATASHLREGFHLDCLGPRALKGKSGQTTVFRLKAPI